MIGDMRENRRVSIHTAKKRNVGLVVGFLSYWMFEIPQGTCMQSPPGRMRCEVAMNLVRRARRGHMIRHALGHADATRRPIARFYLYLRRNRSQPALRNAAENQNASTDNGAYPEWYARPTSHSSRYYGTTPCSRSVRAAVGGTNTQRNPESDGSEHVRSTW